MKRPSFSTQLVTSWILVAAICAMLIALVWFTANSAQSQQIAGARQQAAAACEAVAARYSRSISPADSAQNTDLMHSVLDIVLAQAPGIEGGFWASARARASAPGRFLAYAFPTYQGSGVKRDVPEAETPLIVSTLHSAAAAHRTVTNVISSGQDAVIAAACPVSNTTDVFAWMLNRARPPLGPYGEALVATLAAVLAVILVVATALALALRRWKQDLARVETSLATQRDGARLSLPGEPDLDRIVAALNRYIERTDVLQRQASDLGSKLAQAERFSVLGKLAAQVAHEIRNPAGAMRLKAENALAGDSSRHRDALQTILEQIGRIETQLSSLLALTQPVSVNVKKTDLAAWLTDVVESHRELAQARGITLMPATELVDDRGSAGHIDTAPEFDPEQLRRALDNLLVNALRHAGEGGVVNVHASHECSSDTSHLRIAVSDSGPGVPASQRERIFEPFVTGRPDGSGLGLAVVREVAAAHGGRAWLDDTPKGASFVIEIPWQRSS
ncbi:MAG TPA: HAMP domain-containing sensor histidine kinase [Trinickia sp.]|uniref:sensor histidine kinase n=1 Tax=Trinickia sp. TaxID=2571163 RepID=UPI002F3F353A